MLKKYAALHIIVLILAVTTTMLLLPGLCRAWLVDGFETRFSPPPSTDPPSVLHGNRQPVTGNGDTSASSSLSAHSESNSEDENHPDWREPMTGMTFVWVPKGCFMMGSNDGKSDEKPVHKVWLDGFWMGKYEVTQGQWQKIMGNNPSRFKKGNDFPVEHVSWNDANAFIKKLNSQAGYTFSLPSEAQWEYAARSGGKNQKYSGGDDVGRFAWYSGNGGSTHRVGTKKPNGLGIYDMSGNVWEWCEDIYATDAYSGTEAIPARATREWLYATDAYRKHSSKNPIYAQGGSYRVRRGGGWRSDPALVRCANRGGGTPVYRSLRLGFRLLRTN